MRRQVDHIGRTAHLFQGTVLSELVGYGHDVNRVLLQVKFLNSLEYLLMAWLIKAFWRKHV